MLKSFGIMAKLVIRLKENQMPKSLSTGESKIVPVKMPDEEKQAVKSVLKQGETVSGFMRDAARVAVSKRKRESKNAIQNN